MSKGKAKRTWARRDKRMKSSRATTQVGKAGKRLTWKETAESERANQAVRDDG